MMDLAGFAGFENQPDLRALAVGHEVVMQAGDGEERGDRGELLVEPAVGEDQDIDTIGDEPVGPGE